MISRLRSFNWKGKQAIVLVSLLVLGLLLLWLALVYRSHDSSIGSYTDVMFPLFSSPLHQRLVALLGSTNRTVLAGRGEDGLAVFLDYYLHKHPGPIRRRSLSSGSLEFETSPTAGAFAEFVDKYIISKVWGGGAEGVWVLDNGNNPLSEVDRRMVDSLMERHPQDKFIVVSRPTYQQLEGFKFLSYHRPDDQSLYQLLDAAGFQSTLLQKLAFRYVQSSFEEFAKLMEGGVSQNQFVALFEPYVARIDQCLGKADRQSSGLRGFLRELCKVGSVAEGRQPKGMEGIRHIANSFEGAYYWSDYHYYFAYSIKYNTPCRYPEQISSYLSPVQPNSAEEAVAATKPKTKGLAKKPTKTLKKG